MSLTTNLNAIILGAAGASGGSNGGTSNANGTYLDSGTNYNSQTQFTNGSCYIAWNGTTWAVYTAASAGGTKLYTLGGTNTATSISATSLTVNSGTAPAPSIAVVNTGDNGVHSPLAIYIGANSGVVTGGANAGTSAANGTYLPLAGANNVFSDFTQYCNGTCYITNQSDDADSYYSWYITSAVNQGGTTYYASSTTGDLYSTWSKVGGATGNPTGAALWPGLAAAYVASGAGTTNVNGTFYPASGSAPANTGAPIYENGNGEYLVYSSTAGAWLIGSAANVNTTAASLYYATGTAATMPSSWTKGTGATGNPTVVAYAPPSAAAAPTVTPLSSTSLQVAVPALTTNATSCNIVYANNSGMTGATTLTGQTPSSNVNLTGLSPGTEYWVRIDEVNTAGTTQGSVSSGAYTLATAPSALSISPVSASQLNITIPALSGGAASYNLLRAPDVSGSPGTYSSIASSVTPSSTYNDTSLSAGTKYHYALQAVSGGGGTSNGADASGLTYPAAPSAPTISGITTTGMSANPGALGSGAASLNLQITTAADTGFASPLQTLVGVTASTADAFTYTLSPGTGYLVRAQAVNASGTTNGTATAVQYTLPTAPVALTLTPVSQVQINVTIPALSGGATSYNLQRAPDSSGSPGTYATIATTVTPSSTYLDTTLSAGTVYHYRLIAVNAGAGTNNGADASAITFPASPAAPVLMDYTDTQINVTVPSLSTGAVSLNLLMAPDISGSPGSYSVIQTGSTPGAVVPVTGLTPGNKYWFAAVAVNAAGSSQGSGAAATETPNSPAAPVCTVVSGTAVNVAIPALSATQGATSYILLRKIGSGGWVTIATGPTPNAIYSDTSGLSAGETVQYCLIGVDAGGNSTNGAATTVITSNPPGQVTGLTAIGDGRDTYLTANNNPAGDSIVQYNLYSSSVAGSGYSLVGSNRYPDFIVSTPASGVTVYYKMAAQNVAGVQGAYSAYIAVTANMEGQVEKATVFQGMTVAGESSPGVLPSSPAWFKLLSVVAEIKFHMNQKAFKPRGVKGATSKSVGKEYTEFTLSGVLTYDECVFFLTSIAKTATPALVGTSTIANLWTIQGTAEAQDTPQTYTVQLGDVVSPLQVSNCAVTDFALKVDENNVTFTATMAGWIANDSPGTLASGVTELPQQEVQPGQIGILYGATVGAMALLSHLNTFDLEIKNRWKPAFFRDPTKPSFSGWVEKAPEITYKLNVEQDTDAATLLAATRATGSPGFLGIEATGPQIDTGTGPSGANINYGFNAILPALFINAPGRGDKDAVWSGDFEAELAHNTTYGQGQYLVTNLVPAADV